MAGHWCLNGERNEKDSGWPEYDAQGIYLTRVCERCERQKLAAYRPEILNGYTQAVHFPFMASARPSS